MCLNQLKFQIVCILTGIEYTIDHIKGCTIGALKTKDPGVDVKQKALDGTDFFTVDFKDPNTLFYLNENYIYVGKVRLDFYS